MQEFVVNFCKQLTVSQENCNLTVYFQALVYLLHLPIKLCSLDVTQPAGFTAAEKEDVCLCVKPQPATDRACFRSPRRNLHISSNTSYNKRNQFTHCNKLVVLQLDDISHLNVLPFFILQALKVKNKTSEESCRCAYYSHTRRCCDVMLI